MRVYHVCLILYLAVAFAHSLKHQRLQCQITEKAAMCANKTLKKIPKFEADNKIEKLDMSGNDLDELFQVDFKGLNQLKYLHLNYNSIEYIEDDTFEGLPQLEYLDLSKNLLEDVPETLIENNTNLLVLDLSGNIFYSEPPTLISESLEVLDLSFSKISVFTEENLRNLPNLRFLNINSNNLQKLNADMFSIPQHFMYVEFRYNPWACKCETIKLLERLSASGKTDIKEPISCVADDKTHLYIYDKEGPVSAEIFCQTKLNKPASQVKKSFPESNKNATANSGKKRSEKVPHIRQRTKENEEAIYNDIKMLKEVLANEKIYFQELREEKSLVDDAAFLTMKILVFFIFIIGVGMGFMISSFMNRKYLRKYSSRPIIK